LRFFPISRGEGKALRRWGDRAGAADLVEEKLLSRSPKGKKMDGTAGSKTIAGFLVEKKGEAFGVGKRTDG